MEVPQVFGFVVASLEELNEAQKMRYQSVYCGICRAIRDADGQLCRMGLSYDMAFLALLLMSLYEPEEENGHGRCIAHPGKRRPWTDNPYIRYAARMNVALACYKARDDWQDDKKPPPGSWRRSSDGMKRRSRRHIPASAPPSPTASGG